MLAQWAFACVRSRAFAVSDKRTSSASPRAPDPKVEGSGEGAASGGARRAKEKGDGGVFKPSAAAIEEAKAAARKSGGLYVCVRFCMWRSVPLCTFVYAVWCGSSGQPLGALHRTLSPTQDVDCRARHAVGVAGKQKSDVERTHG